MLITYDDVNSRTRDSGELGDPNLTLDRSSVTNFLQSVYIPHKPK
jgi:hypothetical protein